ncbi:MAG: DUF2118 domain-containing protein [Desulfurococcales archaeon]|nr:DUF2118 domain-containing protein [Desulfurococcales archaeon]
MAKDYSREDYRFPIVYAEGVSSTEYLHPDLKSRKYIITPSNKGNGLGKIVYEEGIQLAFDLLKARTTREIAVRVPWKDDKAMLLKRDTPVIIYQVEGVQTVFYAFEGDDLRSGDVLAYVLTGKGETRTVRVDEDATVFYIAWQPGTHPPRYIVVLAREEDLIVLERAR